MATSPYTIKSGDTLSQIAAQNNTTVANLAKINNISDPNKIQAGQTIQLAPISAASLGQPVNAPVITPVNNTTAQNGLGVTANGVAGSSATSTAPITDISQVTDSKSLASFMQSLIKQQATKGDVTAQLNTENDVSGKTQALTDLNNQALQTSKAYDDQIKNLQDNNPEGAFGGGLDIQVNDLTRKKNQDLANIGILQQVAQNNLAAAQSIVKTKVDAQFEPIDNEIQSLGQLYTLYQNDMSDSEKLAAQSAIEDKKTSAANLQNAYQSALQAAVQNGAPQTVLQAIDNAASNPNATEADIYKALGTYGTDPLDKQLKQAQIASANRANQSTTKVTQKDDIASMAQALGSIAAPSDGRSNGGTVSAADYQKAKIKWVQAGYSSKDFDTTFANFRDHNYEDMYNLDP